MTILQKIRSKKNKIKQILMIAIPELKKVGLNKEALELFKIAMEKMRETKKDTMSVPEATNYFNSLVPVGHKISEDSMTSLVKNNLVYADIIDRGKDKKGRKLKTYQISKSDVQNFASMVELLSLAENSGVVKKTKHPEKNQSIITYYYPIQNNSFGIGKEKTKLSVTLDLLSNSVFVDFLLSLRDLKKESA